MSKQSSDRSGVPSDRPAETGFTLVELLTVIAIIALLAAILFPVFSMARAKARAASCASNMRQLGMAIRQYSLDSNETLPTGLADSSQDTYNYRYNELNPFQFAGLGWAGLCSSYIKNAQIFTCPDDQTQVNTPGAVAVSYAFNGNAAGAQPKSLLAPSRTVLLCEVQNAVVNVSDPSEGTTSWTKPPASGYLSPISDGYYVAGKALGFGSQGVAYTLNYQIKTLVGCNGFSSGTLPNYKPPCVVNAAGRVGGQTGVNRTGARPSVFAADQGRHQGGANYVCADGHTVWARPEAISSGNAQLGSSQCAQDYVVSGTGCVPYTGVSYSAAHVAAGTGNLGSFLLTFSPM